MPSQTSPWNIGVWPLALALLLHALPWWAMHQRGGSGEGLRERVMRFREIRLLAQPPLPDPAQAMQNLAPQPVIVAPESPAKLDSPPVSPALAPSPSAKPATTGAPSQSPSTTELPPALDPQDPGNSPPPGWIFDPESYVPAEDLDEPPQLVGEWVLNEAAVPKPATKDHPNRVRVVVRMWVSAEGHVDIYQILDADPVVPWLEALLKDLDKSTLKPAVRDGQPVGSSWMVEMDVDLSAGL
ncbi:MAG: hypothetical protein RI920_1020 [Pseudomonadota bacterium]|jgi:hypothetical protein